jgi:hypothetical protein
VAIDSVDFGGGRTVRDLSLSTQIVDDLPKVFSFSGRENGTNAMTLAVMPKGDHQSITLTIADASAWLQLLAQLLREVPQPVNAVTELAGPLGQIPILLSGGRCELDGDLRPRDGARWFDGQFKLTDIVIRQPPRILQLVALKSGKRLRENPVIKEFSVGRLFVSQTLVALEGIRSDAVSLNYLKLNFIRYGLADASLHLDGQYAGIGFEVLGTRAEPQVFLKNNLLIRAIGSEQEFAFDDVPSPPPPPPPQKKNDPTGLPAVSRRHSNLSSYDLSQPERYLPRRLPILPASSTFSVGILSIRLSLLVGVIVLRANRRRPFREGVLSFPRSAQIASPTMPQIP